MASKKKAYIDAERLEELLTAEAQLKRIKAAQRYNDRIGWLTDGIGILVGIAVAIGFGFIQIWPRLLEFYATYLAPSVQRFWLNVVGAVLIFLIGVGLHYFKRKARVYYGVVEVAFAIAAGWHGVTKTSESGIGEAVSIIAAVYFVVRGLDNIYSGIEERNVSAIANQPAESNA